MQACYKYNSHFNGIQTQGVTSVALLPTAHVQANVWAGQLWFRVKLVDG